MQLRAILTRVITLSLIATAFVAAVLGGLQAGFFDSALTPDSVAPIDFATLEKAPGGYLAAPDGFTPGTSDGEAPVLGIAAGKLMENWNAVIARQAGIEKIAESADGLQIDYIQRSPVLRLPELITVRFIPMPSDPETGDYATLAIYSRSAFGLGGIDARKERVTKWLNGL